MENKENLQHSQLPNDLGEIKYITPIDLLVYTTIKFFTNKDTKECFPSISKIQEWSGLGRHTIDNSIFKLIESGFMSRKLIGRCYHYYFEDYDSFEPFGKEFLSNKELSPYEKALIIAESRFMYKHDIDKTGQITFTNKELSELIHMPESTISKCNRELRNKGFVQLRATENYDGKIVQKKIYNLEKLGQAIVFALKNHEERIQKNEKDIHSVNDKIDNINDKVDMLINIIATDSKYKKLFEKTIQT